MAGSERSFEVHAVRWSTQRHYEMPLGWTYRIITVTDTVFLKYKDHLWK